MKSKSYLIIVIITLISTYLLMSTNFDKKEKANKINDKKLQTKGKVLGDVTSEEQKMPKEHSKQAIDCKMCHICEYPTKNDPCLSPCPRFDMISVHHSPDEGPVIVRMNLLPGLYGEVIFSHKLHAEMSEMTGGCVGCHHYNTTGPVLKCRSCHPEQRIREDLLIPDLEAAYHRQCLNCHRQWSRSTSCIQCHITSEEEAEQLALKKEIEHKQKQHPKLNQPLKIVYETSYEKGKYATFFHDEHTNLFGAACVDCHKNENCMKCHDVKLKELRNDERPELKLKANKTFEEHHKPCISCHKQDECSKCHSNKPLEGFDHFRNTGFDLAIYHSRLKCQACHKESGNFKGLNSKCTSCHTDFVPGKFNHSRVGLKLDDNHIDLECSDCHKKMNFNKKPVCDDCHDNFVYPNKIPGKRIVNK